MWIVEYKKSYDVSSHPGILDYDKIIDHGILGYCTDYSEVYQLMRNWHDTDISERIGVKPAVEMIKNTETKTNASWCEVCKSYRIDDKYYTEELRAYCVKNLKDGYSSLEDEIKDVIYG